jgi:cation:H+ antiporter
MTIVPFLLIVIGFLLLIRGALWLVEGASVLARGWGAPDLLVGLTVVSIGTTTPELVVTVSAALSNNSELALANIVGSCLTNVLLILGASALIAPLAVAPSVVFKEIPFYLLASLIAAIVTNDIAFNGDAVNVVSRSDGLILLGFLSVFVYYLAGLKNALKQAQDLSPRIPNYPSGISVRSPWLYILSGLGALLLGGELTVRGATSFAQQLGVTDRIIGLTVVAVGTSLPELLTAIVATMRGKIGISIGNVIGSNILNIFWILGVSATITPLNVSPAFNRDVTTMVISGVLLLLLIQPGPLTQRLRFWRIQHGHVLTRAEGALLFVLYLAHVTATILW